jgi:hypothetical protein
VDTNEEVTWAAILQMPDDVSKHHATVLASAGVEKARCGCLYGRDACMHGEV